MPKHRTRSIEFKRQVVQDYLGGETLYGLAKRHEISPEPLIACASRLADSAVLRRDGDGSGFPPSHTLLPAASLIGAAGFSLVGLV
jgi:transposase-like protein